MSLLDAIGAALGLDGPYEEIRAERAQEINLSNMTSPPAERAREVLGGAVHPDGRVGWFDLQSEAPVDGYLPIDIQVRVAVEGKMHMLPLATYNPYFGCSVHHASWVGDAFTYVYTEKHRTILGRLPPPYDTQELVAVDTPMLNLEDRVVWLDAWQGLLRVRRLSDLMPGIAVLTPLTRRADGRIPMTQELRYDEGRLSVATWPEREAIAGWEGMEWRELHDARRRRANLVEIALPPVDRLPAGLEERWRSALKGAPSIDRVLAVVGEPWLAAPAVSAGYGPWSRPSMDLPSERLSTEVRAALPDSEVVLGWPDEGSLDERIDRIFFGALARAV